MRQKGTRMISAFLLCLALTLSGCSTQPPAESDSTPPSSSADSSAAEENQVAASPEEGVEIAQANLEVDGRGHSVSIHSDNDAHLEYAGNRLEVAGR